MMQRLGESVEDILQVQFNLATSYQQLGRLEEALRLRREVYSGRLKLHGAEHEDTLREAFACAWSLLDQKRFKEGKSLLLKKIPVVLRVLGTSHEITLSMRLNYAAALCMDDGATLDDLREAVTIYEDMEPIVRRVFGSAHPLTRGLENNLRETRADLRARETPSP